MNNKFNKVELKNKNTRNDINNRMQGFYGPESPESKKSNLINYKELNSKLINNIQKKPLTNQIIIIIIWIKKPLKMI